MTQPLLGIMSTNVRPFSKDDEVVVVATERDTVFVLSPAAYRAGASIQVATKFHASHLDIVGPYKENPKKDKPSTGAFSKQVGGGHYTNMKTQPLELVLERKGYAAFEGACLVKIDKYLYREKDDKVQQLEKALDILQKYIEVTKKHLA